MFERERETFLHFRNLESNSSTESAVLVSRDKNKKRIIITYTFYCGIFKNSIEVSYGDQ